jgi:hypothetical protein
MAALMWLLVEATGPRGGGWGGGSTGGGSEALWLAAATEADRQQIALWAATLADCAIRLAISRACKERLRGGPGSRGDWRAVGALADAVCGTPDALAALVAAAGQVE